VAETTVRNAIREARKLGLVTVEERRVTGFRNDTNVVRIVSAEWTAWLRLARKGVVFRDPLGGLSLTLEQKGMADHHPPSAQGGGCKSAKRTHTNVPYFVNSVAQNTQKGCRQAAGDLFDGAPLQNCMDGRTGRAMQ
jgi:hypothetical protein